MSRPNSEIHELVDREDDQWGEYAQQHHTSLPKADGGRQAWLFLASCFLLEAFIWGFPFSYGVFQVYYSTHAPFSGNSTGVAAIGTTQTGLMYFSAPVASLVMQRWPHSRRPGMVFGTVLIVVALIAASFCNSVGGLLATQGIMYAIGGLILYYPAMVYVDEWFIAKKGLAYGVMWAGSGSAGVVVPFLLQWLLETYGFRTALRVWAVILAIGVTPCLFFVKERLPISNASALRPIDFAFMKHAPFWIFLFGAIFQSFAFFLPALWLPSFALSIGLPKFSGPLGLAFINLTTCMGAILVGLLMVAIFLFWGLTSTQPMFYIFALLWGLFGGGFSSTWSGYVGAVARQTETGHVDAGLLISLMAAGRGVGAVITGPLSETLLQSGWNAHAEFAYGTKYGILIIFSGVFATFSGTACVGRMLKLL